MKRLVSALLLVVGPLASGAAQCSSVGGSPVPAAPLTSTANEDDGEHKIRQNFGGAFEYGKTIAPKQRFQACRWHLDGEQKDGRKVLRSGTERNKVTIPQAGVYGQMWLVSKGCGAWGVK